MKRFYTDGDIPPLKVVLAEYMNAGEIKKLAVLTGLPIPTRKADLVDLIVRYLDGDGLRTVWEALDELQRAAVAEVVHGSSVYFAADRFRAKYGGRGARVQDCGLARLVECAEPALAALIANDTRTRKHCMRAGERHLVVPASAEAAFRRALRDIGYLLASGGTRVTKRRDRGSDRLGPPAIEG